jgi:hypothetical protein
MKAWIIIFCFVFIHGIMCGFMIFVIFDLDFVAVIVVVVIAVVV